MFASHPDVTTENDLLLSRFTIRLRDSETQETIGTGVLYKVGELKDKFYVLTAAHVLFGDGDTFRDPLETVCLDFYNVTTNSYSTVIHEIDPSLVGASADKDVAILLVEDDQVKNLINDIPSVICLSERRSVSSFIIKGFPAATRGQEIVTINPLWKQNMTGVSKFQLELKEDYDGWSIDGFSGSGAFLYSSHQLYLYGIFTRYREERKGRVIYCQYLEAFNELLQKSFLPTITFTYLGEHGLDRAFFERQVGTAISNLGPRFNEKLNFRLSMAWLFNDLARDGVFRRRFTHAIDRWLTDKNFNHNESEDLHLEEIEAENGAIRVDLIPWLSKLNWMPDHPIEWQSAADRVMALNEKIAEKRRVLFDLQYKERDQQPDEQKAHHNYRSPYEVEINRLWEIERNNDSLLSSLETIDISLSNHPYLLIKGDAGCGKSHLLGDIATERMRKDEPTVLLLGQLFRANLTVWQNILLQLGLSCSKDQFLQTLNSIGKQIGARTLILIDALNEGAGREVWPDEMSGFIKEVARYPFIGLCMTVRSTYFTLIVPENVKNDPLVTFKVHEGFKGNEYEALRLFCEYYELQQPNFPLLFPEFTSPLFLQLICEGVRNSKEKVFPQGFQGISKIFDYYLKAVSSKLIKKREEYELKPKIVNQAVEEVAKALMGENEVRELPLQEMVELFETKFPAHRYLLSDLIHENIFIQNIRSEPKSQQENEVILFSYERFGDFILAEELLKPFDNREKIMEVFREDKPLGKLLEEGYWYNRGILEIMAVLLPEKFKLEIFEVFRWAFIGKHTNLLGNIDEYINHFLLDSLKWRIPESIDDEKITDWINSEHFNLNDFSFYNVIVGLTTINNHPFNGDRFHRILMRDTMSERDGYLQNYLRYYAGYADDGSAFPVKRLLDWAWMPGISQKVSSETARLTGQTLTWVLSSTNRKLRDQTTKAMVNLLEDQPSALVDILKVFKDIDDLYILERLYAIAYGCALRTSQTGSLLMIAQFTYDTIFKDGEPPVHILLRDYARNVVEYAIYTKLPIIGDIELIRPPYNTPMPENIPTLEELEEYDMDREAPDFNQRNGRLHNFVKFSIMDWDFGNKTVNSGLREFCSVSFRTEADYKLFLRQLKKKQKDVLKIYEKFIGLELEMDRRERRYSASYETESYKSIRTDIRKYLQDLIEDLRESFSPEQYSYFSRIIVPYLKNKQKEVDYPRDSFDKDPIKRWMVKRAYGLGYDVDLHGFYDYSVDSYNNRSGSKIERIGKKYQWIAFHEAMAMVADNYKILENDNDKRKYVYYKGPWQRYLRDINPSYTTKNLEELEDQEARQSHGAWWLDQSYHYWDGHDKVWLEITKDLPDARQIIQRIDNEGKEWLYLHTTITWEEPKPIGKDKYRVSRKELWYLFQAYLVKKKDRTKIVSWMQEQDFKGRWMPESHSANLGLINRENYWAPAAAEHPQKWESLPDSKHKVMVATAEAVGELGGDKSGAHRRYGMPCQLIFEGMKLQYSSNDGDFTDSTGVLIAINTPEEGVLISKEHLQKFLDESDLDIVWAQLGEKQAIGKDDEVLKYNNYKTITGVYYLEAGEVEGGFRLSEDEM